MSRSKATGTPAAAGGSAVASRGPRPELPEDKIYTTDYVLPTLAAVGHAYWMYSKQVAITSAGTVAKAAAAGGPLDISWTEPVGAVIAYLVMVGVLWLYMEGINPMRCRAAMIVHNAYLTLLSAYMMYVLFEETIAVALAATGGTAAAGTSMMTRLFGPQLDLSARGTRLAWILWVNYNSKYLEFLDTTFMLLRKKFRQVTFLHVQHHAVMGPIMWMILRQCPGGTSYWGPLLNSGVHTVMYAYYACLACKIAWPLPKHLITMLQMTQFVVIAWHGLWNLSAHSAVGSTVAKAMGGKGWVDGFLLASVPAAALPKGAAWPLQLIWVELALMVDMLVLFGNFFYQEYVAKKNKSATKAE